MLINAGVNLKATDQYGLTPLVYALKQNNSHMVKVIKTAGGDY